MPQIHPVVAAETHLHADFPTGSRELAAAEGAQVLAPQHVSYLLPLVGTVARTDLAGPELTEPLARAAYQSLYWRPLPLPDELAVYPTHGAGSFCAASAGGERTTTIGAERRHHRLAGDRVPAKLPEGPVAVMCSHGQRAMTAASLLERAGRQDLRVVVGGPEDWQQATGQALARS